MARMQAPVPLPLPPRALPRPGDDGQRADAKRVGRDGTAVVPGALGPKARRKGGAKGKKEARSGHLDQVDREDAALVALGELTSEELDERRRGRARGREGAICEQPSGHASGFHPLPGHAFRRTGGGRSVVPPAYSDVAQGRLSDAWLLAAAAAVAHAAPRVLLDAIQEVGPGEFTVLLGGELLRVTAEFPTEGYADPRPNGQDDTLWVALVEKAFALVEAGSYAHLECGNPSRALEALTGRRARRRALTRHVDPEGVTAELAEAEAEGRPVVLVTRDADLPAPLVGDHAYAVLGGEGRGLERRIQLYNPWGTRGGERPLEAVVHTIELGRLLEVATALHIG